MRESKCVLHSKKHRTRSLRSQVESRTSLLRRQVFTCVERAGQGSKRGRRAVHVSPLTHDETRWLISSETRFLEGAEPLLTMYPHPARAQMRVRTQTLSARLCECMLPGTAFFYQRLRRDMGNRCVRPLPPHVVAVRNHTGVRRTHSILHRTQRPRLPRAVVVAQDEPASVTRARIQSHARPKPRQSACVGVAWGCVPSALSRPTRRSHAGQTG